MHQKWKTILHDELKDLKFQTILNEINRQRKQNIVIYPKIDDIFNSYIDPDLIKVVIVGQDPYHGLNQAHGFSFSVPHGVKPPPSLKNIYKEIENELCLKMNHNNGNLLPWVNQGVMLLNSTLTVIHGEPNSHKNLGWDFFTDATIKKLSEYKRHIVFLLWGNFAQNKEHLIQSNNHLILKSPHPSPFSAHNGFFGNNHFKLTNDYLKTHRQEPINWLIS